MTPREGRLAGLQVARCEQCRDLEPCYRLCVTAEGTVLCRRCLEQKNRPARLAGVRRYWAGRPLRKRLRAATGQERLAL